MRGLGSIVNFPRPLTTLARVVCISGGVARLGRPTSSAQSRLLYQGYRRESRIPGAARPLISRRGFVVVRSVPA